MDPGHTAELVSAQWGALRAGYSLEILPSTSMPSLAELRDQVIKSNPSVILVSLNHKTMLEDSQTLTKKQELLETALPELFQNCTQDNIGEFLESQIVPNLKFIVQTGFYNKPGYLKFRDLMVYRSNKYNMSSKIAEEPILSLLNDGSSQKKENSGSELTSIIDSNLGTLQSDFLNTAVYNILSLQEPRSNRYLLDSLSLGQSRGLFTNVIPSHNLDSLVLDKTFLSDLTEKYGTVVVGNSEDLLKIKENTNQSRIVYVATDQ